MPETEQANLIELLKLLGKDDTGRWMRAEILRQMHDFEAAREALLARPFGDGFAPVVERLQRLIAERNAGLAALFSGEL